MQSILDDGDDEEVIINLMQQGVNQEKVATTLEFLIQRVKKQAEGKINKVKQLLETTTTLLETYLEPWINENGGWDNINVGST